MSEKGPLSGLGGPFAKMSRESQIGLIFVGLALGVGIACALLLLLVVVFTRPAEPTLVAGDLTETVEFPTAGPGTQGVALTQTPGLLPTATEDTGFGLFTPIVQPTFGGFVTEVVSGNTGTPFYIPPPTLPPTPTPIPFVPTNTPIPGVPTPTPQLIITDWLGEYFPNAALFGAPALIRNDVNISFNWGTGAPAPGLPADYFSARWTRTLLLSEGVYNLDVVVDDTARVYIDNQLMLNATREGPAQLFSQIVSLSQGAHVFRVEFIEYTGLASIDFRISRVDFTDAAWTGQYFNNMALSGQPVLTRADPVLSFDWSVGAPAPGIPADRFSVRWTRTLYLPGATYRFYALADDGVRMWVDGQLIIDEWHDAQGGTYSRDVQLQNGNHTLRVEYYENQGAARVAAWWDIITNYPDWRADYFNNPNLQGMPIFIRNEPVINWDWGYGSPGPGIPSDNFSVRWTRIGSFTAGLYRFTALSDDGVRVYIDDAPIINQWRLATGQVYQADVALSGNHRMRVEFFEGPGIARISLNWTRIGDYPTNTPRPSTATLTPSHTPTLTRTPTATPTTPMTVPPAITDTPTATATFTPTLTPTATHTLTPTEDPIFITQTAEALYATQTQEAIYAQQTADAIGEANATATAEVVHATQTQESLFATATEQIAIALTAEANEFAATQTAEAVAATETAVADASFATQTAEAVFAQQTAEAAAATQTADAVFATQTLEAGAAFATQTAEAIFAQQTAEAEAFATQTAEAEAIFATQTAEAVFAQQTAEAEAFATQTAEAIFAQQTAEAGAFFATQTAEAVFAQQTAEAEAFATQTAEAEAFFATQTAEAVFAQQTAEAAAVFATQTAEAEIAMQLTAEAFFATQTAEAIFAQQTAEAGAVFATQTAEAIFAQQTAEAFYAQQTAEAGAVFATQTAEAFFAQQTAEAAFYAQQTADAEAVFATQTAEAIFAQQTAEAGEFAATQTAEAIFAQQTAEASVPTEPPPPPVEGVDALDATYFPFRGIDWASQVFVIEGTVSNLRFFNDEPFIQFDLMQPDGSVVAVEGVRERVDLPVVFQAEATPLPTPSLTPTAEGVVEPQVMSEGQISPVVRVWQPVNGVYEPRLVDGDTVVVLGLYDATFTQLTANAIWLRQPDTTLSRIFYRSLLHQDELTPDLARYYADMTIWVVTDVSNAVMLTQGAVDLTASYAPDRPLIVRGRVAWDGATTVWLDNVYAYIRQAPREYTEVFHP